jgi:hypothetical protein
MNALTDKVAFCTKYEPRNISQINTIIRIMGHEGCTDAHSGLQFILTDDKLNTNAEKKSVAVTNEETRPIEHIGN